MGDRRFYGAAVIGERGQFAIPKDARTDFGIEPGDKIVIFGKEGHGLLIMKAEKFKKVAEAILGKI